MSGTLDGLGRSDCRGCGQEMAWIKTSNGKNVPLDPEPRSDGNIVIEAGVAKYIPRNDAYTGERFVSHFSTCPTSGREPGPGREGL